MFERILSAHETGATILTVNHRLARSVRRQYNHMQSRHGNAAWPTARVQMLTTWMSVLWREVQAATGDSRPVLSEDEVAVLWQRVVEESEFGAKLLQIRATAALAAEAWKITRQWRIPVPSTPDGADHDFAAYIGWAAGYRDLLDRNGWIDPADVPDLLRDAIAAGALQTPEKIVLAGFSEFEPQVRGVLDALRLVGCTIELDVLRPRTCEPRVVSIEDHAEEIASAARWARNLLDRGATGPIGILVPDIAAVRPLVEATFTEYLQPGTWLPGATERPPAFNISIGRPLSDWPIVHAALLSLELCRGPLPMDRVSQLLRTPFIAAGADELSERAVLDAWLRRRGHATLSVDLLAELAKGGARSLASALRRLRPICTGLSGDAPPSDLAGSIADMLSAIGWPHGRTLGSAEYQAAEKFWEVLGRYAALDAVLPTENFHAAVARLTAMMDDEIFQPAHAEAPVQILGLLEGVGQQFEHLWIAGMHDEIVPAAPSPNPFLPIALQRYHKVARSSAERELDFATKLVDGLFCSSEDVWISWPRNDGERQLRPSPLIARSGFADRSDLPGSSLEIFERIIHRTAAIETFVDEHGPAVEEEITEGGTWLLQDQAACPFRAFVRHRLHTRRLESPAPGMDPRERGTLVHTVLQLIWDPTQTSSLKGHAELANLDDATLKDFVSECVDAGIRMFEESRPEPLAPRYRGIEKERLAALIFDWLRLERSRSPFAVVETEHNQQVDVGKLRINVRIDRIDELGDGRRVFIDYKTSKPYASKWRGERPDEPQLPIYCTTCDNVAAVSFGQLRAGNAAFIGLAEEEGVLPGIRTYKGDADAEDWSGLMASWHRVLDALSAEFRDGVARVDPKKPETCRLCDLELICRVAEGSGLEEAEVED